MDAPLIDFRVARTVGVRAVRPGPQRSAAGVRAVVDGLRAAAEQAVEPVAEVTGLEPPAEAGTVVLGRAGWVRANVEMVETMITEACGGVRTPRWPHQHAGAKVSGAEIGGALGLLSSRVLGQYLPFLATPKLVLVAPNIAAAEDDLRVVPRDFRLWVCLHEQTHRAQFAAAPWLRGYLIDRAGALLDAPDAGLLATLKKLVPGQPPEPGEPAPTGLLGLTMGPEQRAVFADVTAVMSLLEGYADVVMDRVGPGVVGTVDVLRTRFEGRRRARGWAKLLDRLLGMDTKLAQYRDGAAFCRAVLRSRGMAGLNLVYSAPALLPSVRELHYPDEWLARTG